MQSSDKYYEGQLEIQRNEFETYLPLDIVDELYIVFLLMN